MNTYNNIREEVIAELSLMINWQEYFTPEYFSDEFLKTKIEKCNCHQKLVLREDFDKMMLDIPLSYKTRPDIKESIQGVFSKAFIDTGLPCYLE